VFGGSVLVLAVVRELLELEVATPTLSGKQKDQHPPSRYEEYSGPPIRFVLTATVQCKEDSKDNNKRSRNAALKSRPKLKYSGQTRPDLFWSFPLGFGNAIPPAQEECGETDDCDHCHRQLH